MFRDYNTGRIKKGEAAIAVIAILLLLVSIVLLWNNPPKEYDPCAAEGKTKVVTEYRSGVQYGRHTQLEVFTCK